MELSKDIDGITSMMRLAQSELRPFSLQFKSQELESRFTETQASIQSYSYYIGMGFLALMYMALAVCQILFTAASILANIGLVLLGVIALLSFSYLDNQRMSKHFKQWTLMVATTLLTIALLFSLLPSAHLQLYMAATVGTLAWLWLLSGISFAKATIIGWVTFTAYSAVNFFLLNRVASEVWLLTVILFLCCLFSTVTTYLYERRLRSEFANDTKKPLGRSNTAQGRSIQVPIVQRNDAPVYTESDTNLEWAQCLKQMSIELASTHDTELLFSRLLEHIKTLVPFDTAAVGKVRNNKMAPLIIRDGVSNLSTDETIKLLWTGSLLNKIQESKDVYTGEADIGLLQTSLNGQQLSFGHRLDIPFFSKQKLNGVVTLLRKKPGFNELEMSMASSMVFHGMFARRSANLQQTIDRMSKKRALKTNPASNPTQNKASSITILSADDFIEQAETRFRRLQTSGEQISLLLIEVDDHEELGHEYGEKGKQLILNHVGHILQQCVVEEELLGYYGRGSFATQLAMDLITGKAVAENIRRRIEAEKFTIQGNEIPITVSIGISGLSGATLDFLSMLRSADLGLFMARDANGNAIKVNI